MRLATHTSTTVVKPGHVPQTAAKAEKVQIFTSIEFGVLVFT